MSPVRQKWRPALWMVVFGTLTLVAVLPLLSLALIVGFETWFDIQFRLRSLDGFLALAVGSLLMAGIIGAVFLRTLLRPLQELIARTAEIEAGSPEAFRTLDQTGTREGATLATRFFNMARKLSDRSSYLALFSRHLSHELKTPLTSIQGAAELLKSEKMAEEQRERFLSNIIDDTTRLAALATRLRQIAQADTAPKDGQCGLQAVLETATASAGLTLQAELGDVVTINMPEENALIAFQQLAENAAQTGATLFKVRWSKGTCLIGDDGPPISNHVRDQILVPFFTTRRDEGGTGMGLDIVATMLKHHDGDIRLSDQEGWKFEITI